MKMNQKAVVTSLGNAKRTMEIHEALSWFSDNGFKYTGRWEDEKGKKHLIFTKGINGYQMIVG